MSGRLRRFSHLLEETEHFCRCGPPDVITSALAGPFFDSHSRLILDSPEIPLLRVLE